jgi:putative membrane protein
MSSQSNLNFRDCLLGAALVVLFCSFQVRAQGPVTVPGDNDRSQLAGDDRDFAVAAAQDSQSEIALSQLAEQLTSSEMVKSLAEKLQRDHLESADRLREIGDAKRQPLPTVQSEESWRAQTALSQLSGSLFDHGYLDLMVAMHRHDIDTFAQYAASGSDPDLRGFADRMLPKLRSHLSDIEDVRKSIQ